MYHMFSNVFISLYLVLLKMKHQKRKVINASTNAEMVMLQILEKIRTRVVMRPKLQRKLVMIVM